MKKRDSFIAIQIVFGLITGAIASKGMAAEPHQGVTEKSTEHVISIKRADKHIDKIHIPFKPDEVRQIDGITVISGEKDGIYHDMLPLKLEPGDRMTKVDPVKRKRTPAASVSLPNYPRPELPAN